MAEAVGVFFANIRRVLLKSIYPLSSLCLGLHPGVLLVCAKCIPFS